MACKKKINPKAIIALQKYREEVAAGVREPAKRKSASERLADKKLKLLKLQKEIVELKTDISKLDATVNKTEKAKIVKEYTAEELAAAIKLLKAQH